MAPAAPISTGKGTIRTYLHIQFVPQPDVSRCSKNPYSITSSARSRNASGIVMCVARLCRRSTGVFKLPHNPIHSAGCNQVLE